MVISCSAFGCKNRHKKGSDISFHRFPLKRPNILAEWVIKVRRKNFKPTKNSNLCSDHFIDTDYQIRPNASYKLLREDAVPSVFDGFPSHLRKSPPKKRRLLHREVEKKVNSNGDVNADEDVNGLNILENSKDIECIIIVSDQAENSKSTQCNISSPTKQRQRRRIKILQQRLKRRDERIKTLKRLLYNIKRKIRS